MAWPTQCLSEALAGVVLNVAQHDASTLLYISLCCRSTNATGCSGDDRDLSFQTLTHCSLLKNLGPLKSGPSALY